MRWVVCVLWGLAHFRKVKPVARFYVIGNCFPQVRLTGTVWVFFLFLSLCQICIFVNKLPCRLRFWWDAWSCLFLWHILVMIFCFLAHCKQFLGSWEVFCYMVDYAILFSEPETYCRVSSSCGTTDEIKVSPLSPVFLFMLSTVEQRVFYFCFYSCLFFLLFLSLSILVYLWNKMSTVRYSLCKRSGRYPDPR